MCVGSSGFIVAVTGARTRGAAPNGGVSKPEGAVMTATSVSMHGAATRSWTALQRAAAWALVLLAVVALSFTAGRVSVSVHHRSSVTTPASISVPSGPDASAVVGGIRLRGRY